MHTYFLHRLCLQMCVCCFIKTSRRRPGNRPARRGAKSSCRQWTPPAWREFILLLLIHTLPWPHLSFIRFFFYVTCCTAIFQFITHNACSFSSICCRESHSETWPVKHLSKTVYWTCRLQSFFTDTPFCLFVWFIFSLWELTCYNFICFCRAVIALAWLLFAKWATRIEWCEV